MSENLQKSATKQDDYRHLWRPLGIEGIELFEADIKQTFFPKHMHHNYTICLTEAGRGRVFAQDKEHLLSKDDIMLLNPQEVHAGGAQEGCRWRYKVIYIDQERMAAQLHTSLDFKQVVVQNTKLKRAFMQTFDKLSRADAIGDTKYTDKLAHVAGECDAPEHNAKLASIANDFIETLVQQLALKQPRQRLLATSELPIIQHVRDYIHTHYSQNLSMQELAEVAGVSANYLIRAFRKVVGLPPHAYQVQVRLLHAKKALLSDQAIADIALEAGFFDQSHLNRCFKRVFGVTPNQYRQLSIA